MVEHKLPLCSTSDISWYRNGYLSLYAIFGQPPSVSIRLGGSVSPDQSQAQRPRTNRNHGLGILKGPDTINDPNLVGKILRVSSQRDFLADFQIRKQIELRIRVKLNIE